MKFKAHAKRRGNKTLSAPHHHLTTHPNNNAKYIKIWHVTKQAKKEEHAKYHLKQNKVAKIAICLGSVESISQNKACVFQYHAPSRCTWAEVAPAIWSSCSNSATRAEADRCSADCLNSHVETSLDQQQAHCMICMVSCQNIPKCNGPGEEKRTQHNQFISSTSIWLPRVPFNEKNVCVACC